MFAKKLVEKYKNPDFYDDIEMGKSMNDWTDLFLLETNLIKMRQLAISTEISSIEKKKVDIMITYITKIYSCGLFKNIKSNSVLKSIRDHFVKNYFNVDVNEYWNNNYSNESKTTEKDTWNELAINSNNLIVSIREKLPKHKHRQTHKTKYCIAITLVIIAVVVLIIFLV